MKLRTELVITPVISFLATLATLSLGGSLSYAAAVFFCTPVVFLSIYWLSRFVIFSMRGQKMPELDGR